MFILVLFAFKLASHYIVGCQLKDGEERREMEWIGNKDRHWSNLAGQAASLEIKNVMCVWKGLGFMLFSIQGIDCNHVETEKAIWPCVPVLIF